MSSQKSASPADKRFMKRALDLAHVFSGFARSGLVDEWQLIESPVTLGKEGVPAFTGGCAPRFKIYRREKLGRDVLCLARQV